MSIDTVSPRTAAKLLGVCRVTIYRWADKALHGERSPLDGVKRNANGRILIPRESVTRLVRDNYRIKSDDY